MAATNSKVAEELNRLHGAQPRALGGVGTVRFTVEVDGDPSEVFRRARQVLTVIDEHALSGWPGLEEWRRRLPAWFVAACAPEMSQDEQDAWLAQWRSLNDEDRAAMDAAQPWSLDNWLYWMEPENRQWWWWSATVNPPTLAAEVEGWPFPWGALSWLLQAAGATAVRSDDDGM